MRVLDSTPVDMETAVQTMPYTIGQAIKVSKSNEQNLKVDSKINNQPV